RLRADPPQGGAALAAPGEQAPAVERRLPRRHRAGPPDQLLLAQPVRHRPEQRLVLGRLPARHVPRVARHDGRDHRPTVRHTSAASPAPVIAAPASAAARSGGPGARLSPSSPHAASAAAEASAAPTSAALLASAVAARTQLNGCAPRPARAGTRPGWREAPR